MFKGNLPIRRRLKQAAFGALTLAVMQGLMQAQSTQGTILGTVKDLSGALVRGAVVTLDDTDQGTVRTTTSNSSGAYHFDDVRASHYKLDVAAPGFRKWEITNFAQLARQELRLDATLAVGDIQQEVKVSGDAVSTVDTESASISAVYSAAEAMNLPVNTRASSTGTSALSIVGTLPGVQADHGQFGLQGGIPWETEVAVDGITVQSTNTNGPIADAFPSSESISELRADGSLNNAEFGQPGEITVTTKGGANIVHGSLFWYHQNAALNAIAYTYPTTKIKPKLIGNTFGASFGGPVVIPHFYDGHNRTFFFGVYEGWRHPAQTTALYKVPSTLMKQGDFSRYTSTGFTGLANPFTSGSYGTKLPSINSASQKLLQFYPDPNIGDPTAYTDNTVANYMVNKDSSGISDQFDVRADQYFGSNQKFLLWGRYTWKDFPTNTPEPLAVPSAKNTNQSRVLKFSANWTITPRLINEAGFGFTLSTTGQANSFDGKSFTQSLGLSGLQNLFFNGVPELDFFNVSPLNADRLSKQSKSNTYVYTDTLSWVSGKHIMKFGIDLRSLRVITPLGFSGADNYGTFHFNTKNSGSMFTGVDFADFLLGLPYQTFYDVVQKDTEGSIGYYHFFAQDQWQATPSLTLTYGLRYELHPPYKDAGGGIGNFDPRVPLSAAAIYPDGEQSLLSLNYLKSANACNPDGGNATNSAVVNGAPCMQVLSNSQAGLPAGLRQYPHLRFMPRFGFAWRPFGNDKTALRGGFGIYNVTLEGSSFHALTGTLQSQTQQYTNTYNATTHAIGYQWPNIYAGAAHGGCSTCYGSDYFGTANTPTWKDPYTEQWSLSVDRDLGRGLGLRVSYIGFITRHLIWSPDENTLPFSSTLSATFQPLSARRFPNWGRVNMEDTGANSTLNSLQTELHHRFQHGLQLNSSWTYSKALADNLGPSRAAFASQGGTSSTSLLDRHADFGNVYATRRHRWNTTMIYNLPFGRGQAFGGSMPKAINAIVGGWRLANIFLWQSGPFESPYYPDGQGDPSGTGSGLDGTVSGFDGGHRQQHPDRVSSMSIKPTNRTRLNWINTAAFTCPGNPAWVPGTACTTGSGSGPVPNPIGRFGNATVGSVVGPGTITLSSGLSKTIALTERISLRLEGTFANVLNHTNLSDPNMNVSSSTFGQVTSSITSDNSGPRNGQISARIDF